MTKITLRQLRALISEEIERSFLAETKKDGKKKGDDDEYDPSAVADDSDVLLDDSEDAEIGPYGREEVKKSFTRTGVSGRLPSHARVK